MFLSHFARTPLPRPSTDRPYIATLTVSHENFGVVRVTLTTDSASYVAWGEEQFYILSGANLFTTGCAMLIPSPGSLRVQFVKKCPNKRPTNFNESDSGHQQHEFHH